MAIKIEAFAGIKMALAMEMRAGMKNLALKAWKMALAMKMKKALALKLKNLAFAGEKIKFGTGGREKYLH